MFVRHLWVQEAALPWPCNQGMSALRFRNAFFGSLFQCFSLWAALLRTEQYRSSMLRVFFSTLLPPQRYKDTMLPFLFNTYCILCKSFLAAVHREVHPLEQSSTLEVIARGPKKSRVFPQSEWCSASRQKYAQVVPEEDGNTPVLSGAAQPLGTARERGGQELKFMVSFPGVQKSK